MKIISEKKTEKINKAIAEFMGWTTEIRRLDLTKASFYDVLISPDKSTVLRVNEELYRLEYHSSWGWLMPVVQKISETRFHTRFHLSAFPINITISGGGGAHIAINQGNCAGEEYKGERLIADTLNSNYMINDEEFQYTSIQLVWLAVNEFIKWYEKNKESL
jgi:hypothetical protein